MANYSIKYAVSATPIEEVLGVNTDGGTDSKKMIHTDIDKSFGGGGVVECSTTPANVKYLDYTTSDTVTDSLLTAGLATDIDFLMIKIREAGSTGTPDVQLRTTTGDYNISTLSGVGDAVILKPAGWTNTAYELFSSGPTTIAKLDILYGLIP
tara:strand:+ start:85 stop:543 length:459 start_codon:yes stop_codon:yes gene_type:complete